MPSMGAPFRCGILGAGKFAATHAAVLIRLPYTDLTTVCDTNKTQCTNFTEQWGGRPCADLPTLLGEHLDLLIITTPDHTHASVLRSILASPHPPPMVIVEKPLCVTPEELILLKSLVPQHQTRIIVEHSRRFNTGVLRMRDLLHSEELGKLLSVDWTYYAGWFHTGVHAVDTLRMLLGECTCIGAERTGMGRSADDPLLHVTLAATTLPEIPIVLRGVSDNPYELFEAEFVCSQGRIRMQWSDVFVDRIRKGTYAPMLWFSEHCILDPIEEALERLYSSCASARRGEKTPLLDGTDFAAACGTMEILFEAMSKAQS